MPACRPRFLTLAQAQQLHPFLQRAKEVRVLMEHAFAPWTEQPCWQWAGWADEKGYGRMAYEDQRSARVHRVTYGLFRGYVLESQVVDHLCRNRLCCNPWHLEAITQSANTQRGARAEGLCRNGLHSMTDPANVIVRTRDGLPRYECRACKEQRNT